MSTLSPIAAIRSRSTDTLILGFASCKSLDTSTRLGIARIAAKARALTTYAVDLADAWLTPLGFTLASPRDPARRGAHIALHHTCAWQISQALRAAGVIPDFRTPDRLRLGYVLDFMDLGLGGWRWYTFNVADAAISLSILLLFVAALRPTPKAQPEVVRDGDG